MRVQSLENPRCQHLLPGNSGSSQDPGYYAFKYNHAPYVMQAAVAQVVATLRRYFYCTCELLKVSTTVHHHYRGRVLLLLRDLLTIPKNKLIFMKDEPTINIGSAT